MRAVRRASAASQISRDVYEELIRPREQRLVRGLKEMGAKVRLQISGNITHLLPGIATLGINVIDVDHMVDLSAVRRALAPKTVIGGNIAPFAGVLRSNPDAIRSAVLDCYARDGNPFMVNAGCEIPSGTPAANLMALCEPVAYRAN